MLTAQCSGGSVLTLLQNSTHADIKNLSYSVLVRKPEHAEYYKSQGMTPIMFKNLDEDIELLKKAASEHDIIINTASAARAIGARALVEGLAVRRKTTGEPVWFIHVRACNVCFFTLCILILLA